MQVILMGLRHIVYNQSSIIVQIPEEENAVET
jgi:hypothetical protein